jgi:hypothetical protein
MSVPLPRKHQASASRRLPGCVDPATANVELRPTVPASHVSAELLRFGLKKA